MLFWSDGACPERLTEGKESNERPVHPARLRLRNARGQVCARQPLLYAALAFAAGLVAGQVHLASVQLVGDHGCCTEGRKDADALPETTST